MELTDAELAALIDFVRHRDRTLTDGIRDGLRAASARLRALHSAAADAAQVVLLRRDEGRWPRGEYREVGK